MLTDWDAEQQRLKTLVEEQFSDVLTDVNELLEYIKSRREGLKCLFAAKVFDLDARWELFKRSKDLLEVRNYTSNAMDILSDCIYDDFYIERRETKDFADIDERLVENYDPEGTDKYAIKAQELYAKRDEWREAVLAEGYRGFIYDW